MYKRLQTNFWDNTIPVPPSECIFWTAACSTAGYGQLGRNGRVLYAHRVAYELTFGPIPDGMEVLHSCDTPICVNPRHLRLGTHKDNGEDMMLRKRNPGLKGSNSPVSKLTWDQVREIRSRYAKGGISHRALGKEYGISNRNVSAITSGQTWIDNENQ